MGKNQAYKAMQRSRVGSSSAEPEQIEDGMMDGSFHSPKWHAARLSSLKTSHTVTWEKFKKKQKEDELRKGELEADKDKMMREYRAQLDAEREMKLASRRNRSGNKSNHKEKTDRDLKKRSSKKRKVTDGVEPDLMNAFVKVYTPKDPTKDLETVRMLDQISALHQSQGSLSSEATSSMKPILTQMVGEGKGKYIRGHGKHHSRKEVATSEGRYRTQLMTQLVHENQYLTSQIQQVQAQLEDNAIAFNYNKDLLMSICSKLNMPVPPLPFMRSNTAEDRRSAADEAEGPRPESSGGQ